MQDTALNMQYRETDRYMSRSFTKLNASVFDNRLPHVRILLASKKFKKTCQFVPRSIRDKDDSLHGQIIVETENLISIEAEELKCALADAMVSLDQYLNGKPGRDGYRNKERAKISKAIGLHPSSTWGVGGKETGDNIGYYLIQDSPLDHALKKLLRYDFQRVWEEIRPQQTTPERSGGVRIKYICPHPECSNSYMGGKEPLWNCTVHDLKAIPAKQKEKP